MLETINEVGNLSWELIKSKSINPDQPFMGFFKPKEKENRVLFCSIIKEDAGYEFYMNDNYDFVSSLGWEDDGPYYPTYEKCYDEMIKFMKALALPDGIMGMNINDVSSDNLRCWRLLEIEEEYPIGGFSLW